jgi:hypothetical protein
LHGKNFVRLGDTVGDELLKVKIEDEDEVEGKEKKVTIYEW